MQTWKAPFDVDDALEVTICRYLREPIAWSRMERHLAVTQAFLPLAGVKSIRVVAPPTDQSRRDTLPPPETVRLPHDGGGRRGAVARHLARAAAFPLGAPHIDMVLLAGRDTQSELERQAVGGPLPALTHHADYQQLFGVSFCIVDATDRLESRHEVLAACAVLLAAVRCCQRAARWARTLVVRQTALVSTGVPWATWHDTA